MVVQRVGDGTDTSMDIDWVGDIVRGFGRGNGIGMGVLVAQWLPGLPLVVEATSTEGDRLHRPLAGLAVGDTVTSLRELGVQSGSLRPSLVNDAASLPSIASSIGLRSSEPAAVSISTASSSTSSVSMAIISMATVSIAAASMEMDTPLAMPPCPSDTLCAHTSENCDCHSVSLFKPLSPLTLPSIGSALLARPGTLSDSIPSL